MDKSESWSSVTQRNTKNLGIWTLMWVLTLAIATFGPLFLWEEESSLTLIAVIINAVFGVGMILANRRYINGLDELLKKIHLEAMAMALGVGIVGGFTYSLLDTTNLINGDAEISVICILIALTYLTGIFLGQKRYA
ncbi:MAG: hypothetical protein KDC80_09365 [Saprospiraceae bacterium]|nr:hypothetical protein [Saprospiraceae bacterium]